jgi:hypothetical protein
MSYDDFDIELARKSGAPDPEINAQKANNILDLLKGDHPDLAEAKTLLKSITDPVIVSDLERIIHFEATCRCILPH